MARRKAKTGGAWKGFVLGMVLAGLAGLMAVWALGASGVRQKVMSKVSVMADRADELQDAWQKRQVPGDPKKAAPAKTRTAPVSVPRAPADSSDRPALAPDPVGPATVPEPATAQPAVEEKPAPASGKDITPDDQKQLRDLLRQINQGH